MPRISIVKCPVLKSDYGWMFDIQSTSELLDWQRAIREPSLKEEFDDALQEVRGAGHATKGWHLVAIARLNGGNLLEAMTKIENDRRVAMESAVREFGRIFVNGNTGWFQMTDDIQVTGTQEVRTWILPSDVIRVHRYPNGKHYYAKIGNLDVEVDGLLKWGTQSEAENAAKRFLAEFNEHA